MHIARIDPDTICSSLLVIVTVVTKFVHTAAHIIACAIRAPFALGHVSKTHLIIQLDID